MPGIDGTGPAGRGPMTGWGFGWCRCGAPRWDTVIPPEQAKETGEQKEPFGQTSGEGGARRPFYGAGRGRRWQEKTEEGL